LTRGATQGVLARPWAGMCNRHAVGGRGHIRPVGCALGARPAAGVEGCAARTAVGGDVVGCVGAVGWGCAALRVAGLGQVGAAGGGGGGRDRGGVGTCGNRGCATASRLGAPGAGGCVIDARGDPGCASATLG
jgi:hypothetical protein